MIFTLVTCDDNKNTGYKVSVYHFEDSVKFYNNYSDIKKINFRNNIKDILYVLCHNHNNDSDLYKTIDSKIYTTFIKDVDSIINKNHIVENSFDNIINNYLRLSKKKQFRRVYTVITPYNQSIMLTDSSIIIGSNHYLGSTHPMYLYYEEYKRKFKNPTQIKYDIAEVLSRELLGEYNFENLSQYIVYEGCVSILSKAILGEADMQYILKYDEEEWNWNIKNYNNVWNTLIGNDLLYSSAQYVINDIINDAPRSSIISADCPPRIGRYIGYRIIESYLNNTNNTVSVDNLKIIANTNIQTILIKSQFNGK